MTQGHDSLVLSECGYLPRLRKSLRALADMAFDEDCVATDVTAAALGLRGRHGRARVLCREPVVMCGAAWWNVLPPAYAAASGHAAPEISPRFADGDQARAGATLFDLHGDMAAIVGFERTFLNFLQRAVGIATQTAAFVTAVADYPGLAILDTRKTQPGYRYFDKYAVRCGGGRNHRLHLGDMVLVKENHVARLGGVASALAAVRAQVAEEVPIQVEVRDLDELRAALAVQCPLVMLDNFTPAMVAEACRLDKGRSLLEVSGGIRLETVSAYCHPNLDRISIGGITHSVAAPDLSLLMEEEE